MLRYFTGGESHGKALVGMLEGFPSNVAIDIESINKDLKRRQEGYGRGDRMKIESDKLEILSGIRGGKSIGSPISFTIENKDYSNWEKYMDASSIDQGKELTKPRPGHGDLSGAIKYNFKDIRNVLERSSARETASRVAIGSIIRQLMRNFNIEVFSHVISIGGASLKSQDIALEKIKLADKSPVRCIDKDIESKMIKEIDRAKAEGDSLGGVFEIIITGLPVGLGSYVQWDRKLDGILAQALMSIQAIKAVEFGLGCESASLEGSKVHDEILYSQDKGYYRKTNNSGGIEGGMSNGENIIIRCYMKPIPTLYKPLQSVDIKTKESFKASIERSDSCAVPAASIVGEMVAITIIGEEFLRKYGGDSLEEIEEAWKR